MPQVVRPADKVILAVCEALGVDPNGVYGFELTAIVGQPLRVQVMGYPTLSGELLDQFANSIGELAGRTATEDVDASSPR